MLLEENKSTSLNYLALHIVVGKYTDHMNLGVAH